MLLRSRTSHLIEETFLPGLHIQILFRGAPERATFVYSRGFLVLITKLLFCLFVCLPVCLSVCLSVIFIVFFGIRVWGSLCSIEIHSLCFSWPFLSSVPRLSSTSWDAVAWPPTSWLSPQCPLAPLRRGRTVERGGGCAQPANSAGVRVTITTTAGWDLNSLGSEARKRHVTWSGRRRSLEAECFLFRAGDRSGSSAVRRGEVDVYGFWVLTASVSRSTARLTTSERCPIAAFRAKLRSFSCTSSCSRYLS